MNDQKTQLFLRIQEAKKNFKDTKYSIIASKAEYFWNQNLFERSEKLLKKLPTNGQLLSQLIEKLKGKSVYKSLKHIKESGAIDSTYLKSVSSLLTHTIIECEKGNKEYLQLVPMLVEKISNAAFQILDV